MQNGIITDIAIYAKWNKFILAQMNRVGKLRADQKMSLEQDILHQWVSCLWKEKSSGRQTCNWGIFLVVVIPGYMRKLLTEFQIPVPYRWIATACTLGIQLISFNNCEVNGWSSQERARLPNHIIELLFSTVFAQTFRS